MKTKLLLTFSMLSLVASAQLNYQLVTQGLTAVTFEIGYSEIEVADVNNDGHSDIVTIGDHGSPNFNATEHGIMVFRGNATGTSFSLVKTGSFGYGGIAIGDVNNDGFKDAAYAMHHNYATNDFGDQLIEVALGNGTGQSWTPWDDGLASNGETYGMFGIDLADVNNDGWLDVGSNSFGFGAGLHVYKNNGNGTWTQTDGVLGGNAKHWAKFGDFNRDGKTDLATASEWGVIWSNDGTGYFTGMQNGFTQEWYIEFDIADFNEDGAQDMVLVDSYNQLQAWRYNTTNSSWVNCSSGLPTNSTFMGCSVHDMDFDGFQDIVAWAPGMILVYKGNGGTSWTQIASIPITETQFSCINTGDFNHDGLGDIVYLAKTSTMNADNYLKVYLSTSANANLSLQPVFPQGNECFMPNSVQFLSWGASVPMSTTATVTIEFSQSGPAGPWNAIATNIPNSGVYQWTTPQVSSNNCFLRYTITNGNSTQIVSTSLPFGIGDCSQLTTDIVENTAPVLYMAPNPAAKELHIELQNWEKGEVQITILDLTGKKVLDLVSSGRETLNISDLSAGIYHVQVSAGNFALNEKLVIAR